MQNNFITISNFEITGMNTITVKQFYDVNLEKISTVYINRRMIPSMELFKILGKCKKHNINAEIFVSSMEETPSYKEVSK